ncbi:MAG TPA: hypothetical protein PKM25_15350 [Candidatus Ozemobacteraceae bacterium]|nr:hypothetical protein [Candidatus Ozemobacteraceae bacterium]
MIIESDLADACRARMSEQLPEFGERRGMPFFCVMRVNPANAQKFGSFSAISTACRLVSRSVPALMTAAGLHSRILAMTTSKSSAKALS